MLGGFTRELDTLLILLVVVRLARDNLQHVATLALNQLWVISSGNIEAPLFNFFPLFIPEHFFAFPSGERLFATSTRGIFEFKSLSGLVNCGEFDVGGFSEARNVIHVEALSGLEHSHVTSLLFFLRKRIHTELTHINLLQESVLALFCFRRHHVTDAANRVFPPHLCRIEEILWLLCDHIAVDQVRFRLNNWLRLHLRLLQGVFLHRRKMWPAVGGQIIHES